MLQGYNHTSMVLVVVVVFVVVVVVAVGVGVGVGVGGVGVGVVGVVPKRTCRCLMVFEEFVVQRLHPKMSL